MKGLVNISLIFIKISKGAHMDYTNKKNNNFNLIRLIASYFVIFAHSFAIQGMGQDFLVSYTGKTHLGQMSVYIFTFLSGIFTIKSIINSKGNFEFVIKKIFKIYPSLIICLVTSIFIGSVFTSLSFKEYWTDPQILRYFINNFFNIFNEHFLPGVFENHPDSSMNGVLWYITFQIRVYFMCIIISTILGKERKCKEKWSLVLLIILIWIIASPDTFPLLGNQTILLGNINFPQYTITFTIGALVFLNIKEINIHFVYVFITLIFMVLFKNSEIIIGFYGYGFIIIALWMGTNKNILKFKVNKDYSYGIFLFGWPIGQSIKEVFPSISPYMSTIFTCIIATLISIFLYNIVDTKMNDLSKKIIYYYYERKDRNEKIYK